MRSCDRSLGAISKINIACTNDEFSKDKIIAIEMAFDGFVPADSDDSEVLIFPVVRAICLPLNFLVSPWHSRTNRRSRYRRNSPTVRS